MEIDVGRPLAGQPALVSDQAPLRGLDASRFDQARGRVLPFVRSLMEKNYEAVGFIPLPRLEQYAERGQILLETENDEPCGYLAFGNGWPTLKVYQCCIQYDARRLEHATNLVNRLIAAARHRGCSSISLWCADDLDANAFWRASGFHFGGQRDNGNRRGRKHNLWWLQISNSRQGSLFETEAAA